MSDTFISYSRKDIAYARLLHKALNENDLETWIDWQDIPPSTEWLQEVYTAIEGANTFIFILSASSILSEICVKEIEHASNNNKRIIPIVINDIEPSKVHPALAAINWIFSRTKDELQPAIESLIEAIQTDYDWVKVHTRLQVRALEWEHSDQDKSFMLQGTDLEHAENWLAESVDKEPEPTIQQTRYIQSSRQEAGKRQRRLLMSVVAALVITVVLGILAVLNGQRAQHNAFSLATQVVIAEEAEAEAVTQKDIAVENARLARIRELTIMSQQNDISYDIAMLLGIESFNSIDNYQTRSNLFRLSLMHPRTKKVIRREFGRKISFSPDGKYLASGGNAPIIIWDTSTGQPATQKLSLEGYKDANMMSFSPDRKTFAAIFHDKIILWDTVSGQPLAQTGTFSSGGHHLIFSPDGKFLIVGSGDSTPDNVILLFDTTSMKEIGEPLQGFYSEGGRDIALSPDGRILAYTSGEQDTSNIILWDIANRRPIGNPLQGSGQFIHSISFNPDGRFLGAVGEGGIELWNVNSGQLKYRIPRSEGHTTGILSISFSPDGISFATSSRDRTIIVWDVESGQPIGAPLQTHQGEVTDVAFSPNGNTMASCSLDGIIILWDMTDDEVPNDELGWQRAFHYGINNAAFSLDRKILAIGHHNGSITLWDTSNWQPIGNPLKEQEKKITGVSFSDDGSTLASASLDGTVFFRDASNGKPMGDPIIAANPEDELVIVLSPDGAILATATHGTDSSINLWDVPSGKRLGDPFQVDVRYINRMAFSPDGTLLAIGSESGFPNLLNVTNRRLIEVHGNPHDGWINSITFSPNGKIMATGSDDATIILWDVGSSRSLGDPLRSHTTAVLSLDYSPDGSMLASTSRDGKIILWDSGTMQPLGNPLIESNEETGAQIIAFKPDGKSLITLSESGSHHSWDTYKEVWLSKLCEKVSRNFTQNEWAFYFSNEPYRKTCEQWPKGE
jgi:WD40 repeat protein